MRFLPFLVTCVLALLAGNHIALAQPLPRSTPEAQGISSAAIQAFIERADAEIDMMNSFMLVRNGHVVAEGWWSPYAPETPHVMYSLSKSFTSTAVGLAVAEGRLSIHDRVIDFFPEEAPSEPSQNLREMRVHDLLRMTTGHETEPAVQGGNDSWVRTFLAHPVPFKPGTHFLYNTPATYMLSAIVQEVSGETVLDYLGPRLFEPLGITNPIWGTSPEGITLGGYGLSVRTEDVAKLGQLYLQKGQWNGVQLLPSEWVEAATSLQTSNGSHPDSDWDQGYGYQFWRSRFGNYRGDGAFGQYCIVMPAQNAVVAITSGVGNMQAVMNLVWQMLQPAMQPEPLPQDDAALASLHNALAGLTVAPASGASSSPRAAALNGVRFTFPENDRNLQALQFDFSGTQPVLDVETVEGAARFAVANGSWAPGSSAFVNGVGNWLDATEFAVAASGGWTADDTFAVKLVLPETPFYTTMRFRFEDNQVTLQSEFNVSFGPTTRPDLVGSADRP